MRKISKLKNGLNFINVQMPGTKAVTVLVLFPVGSRFEEKRISGASHFVEHMMFKGTKKRPDYLEISRELDAVGADYNAFTYKDYTGYYVKVDNSKAKLAFDLLSDIVFNSTIAAAEVEKEKGVIVEELRMYEDNPTMAVDLLFDAVMFGDHPLGWDIGGKPENVRAMTREDLWKYYKKYYSPANAVLVVAGNLESKKIKKLLNHFTNIPGTAKQKAWSGFSGFTWPKGNLPLKERVRVQTRKLDQSHLIMGFPGLSYKDKRIYAAMVMLNILGGGMSSRLFVEVREKRGLAYMVRAGMGSFRDCGVAQIQAGLDPVRLKEALATINGEVKKISNELVSKQELKDAKNSLVGRLALALEDSGTQAERIAKQFWFFPKVESFAETKKKIQAVTIAEVKRIANELFDSKQMRLAVIGPLNKEKVLGCLK